MDTMRKTEAAEILAPYLTRRARKFGVTVVDRDFYEATLSEVQGGHVAEVEVGSRIYLAAHIAPAYRTVRTIARRNARHLI